MSELSPLPDTPLGLYRHYKGGEYEVLGVARHSETHEPLVVYRPLYNATGWWLASNWDRRRLRAKASGFGEMPGGGI